MEERYLSDCLSHAYQPFLHLLERGRISGRVSPPEISHIPSAAQRGFDARFLCIMLLGVFLRLKYSMDHSLVLPAGKYLFFPRTSAIFLLVQQQMKSVWSRLLFASTVSKGIYLQVDCASSGGWGQHLCCSVQSLPSQKHSSCPTSSSTPFTLAPSVFG